MESDTQHNKHTFYYHAVNMTEAILCIHSNPLHINLNRSWHGSMSLCSTLQKVEHTQSFSSNLYKVLKCQQYIILKEHQQIFKPVRSSVIDVSRKYNKSHFNFKYQILISYLNITFQVPRIYFMIWVMNYLGIEIFASSRVLIYIKSQDF